MKDDVAEKKVLKVRMPVRYINELWEKIEKLEKERDKLSQRNTELEKEIKTLKTINSILKQVR